MSILAFFKRLFSKKARAIHKKAYKGKDQTAFSESITAKDPRDKGKNRVFKDSLHPYVQKKVMAVIAEAQKAGLNVDLFEGFRSFERQDYLHDVKHTTKARGGYSWHNYGLAGDVVFKTKTGKWTWSSKCDWALLGKIAIKHGFIWGGSWGWDFAHMEYHSMFEGTKDARELYLKGGLKAVWTEVGKHIKKAR